MGVSSHFLTFMLGGFKTEVQHLGLWKVCTHGREKVTAASRRLLNLASFFNTAGACGPLHICSGAATVLSVVKPSVTASYGDLHLKSGVLGLVGKLDKDSRNE